MRISLVALCCVVGFAASGTLEDDKADRKKLYTPQPEHELLKRFEGTWRFEKLTAAADGKKPDKLGTGEIKAELLGGFFVVCRWSGNVFGGDYSAVQTLGY